VLRLIHTAEKIILRVRRSASWERKQSQLPSLGGRRRLAGGLRIPQSMTFITVPLRPPPPAAGLPFEMKVIDFQEREQPPQAGEELACLHEQITEWVLCGYQPGLQDLAAAVIHALGPSTPELQRMVRSVTAGRRALELSPRAHQMEE
jgi:hypothetical protein